MHLNSEGSAARSGRFKLIGALVLLACLHWAGIAGHAADSLRRSTKPGLFPKSALPPGGSLQPASAQSDSEAPAIPVAASWEGIATDFIYEPPDPHGAAGSDGIIQVVNALVAYWDKSGHAIWGPVSFDNFFGQFGAPAFSDSILTLCSTRKAAGSICWRWSRTRKMNGPFSIWRFPNRPIRRQGNERLVILSDRQHPNGGKHQVPG